MTIGGFSSIDVVQSIKSIDQIDKQYLKRMFKDTMSSKMLQFSVSFSDSR